MVWLTSGLRCLSGQVVSNGCLCQGISISPQMLCRLCALMHNYLHGHAPTANPASKLCIREWALQQIAASILLTVPADCGWCRSRESSCISPNWHFSDVDGAAVCLPPEHCYYNALQSCREAMLSASRMLYVLPHATGSLATGATPAEADSPSQPVQRLTW